MGCCCSSDSPPNLHDDFHVIIHDDNVIIPDDNVNNNAFKQDYKADPDRKGQRRWTVELRQSGSGRNSDRRRPSVPGGQMWTDPDFPISEAIRDYRRLGLHWKRPHEIVKDPVLFQDGASRFDIKQKNFGTCWFLNMVASLAEKPELCRKVISEGSWNPRTDGVCHCRLWRFGEWEDVYLDDHLPVYVGNRRYDFYGAMSGTDRDEMWVPLLEKALARLHGSYNVVSDTGGYPSDGYLTLTGGVAERVHLSPDHPDPFRLFSRIRNSHLSGAFVCGGVPKKNDGEQGLVGAHAYTLTGSEIVKTRDGKHVALLRFRNPHAQGEWNGRWSDRSADWRQLEQGSDLVKNKRDGEFWICLEDFLQYFSNAYICSLTPDFDLDGRSDSLDHMLQIYGEWSGSTAVGEGRSMRTRLRNPRIEITVPPDGMVEEGYVPVVVQLIQKAEHLDYEGIRCDLFRVSRGEDNSAIMYLQQEQDLQRKEYYYSQVQCCFRYRLRPGRHIVIPSMYERDRTKEYLMRIFTPSPVPQCRVLSSKIRLIPK